MIRTETEYREVLRRLRQDREVVEKRRAALVAQGYAADEVERGLEPLLAFQAQLAEEAEWYEQARRGQIPAIHNYLGTGRLLIALRLAAHVSQRELAKRLGVSEAVVSRDERNEYHGITMERAQRIIEALRGRVTTRVDEVSGAQAGAPVPVPFGDEPLSH